MAIIKRTKEGTTYFFAHVYVGIDPHTHKQLYVDGSYRKLRREAALDEEALKLEARRQKRDLENFTKFNPKMTFGDLAKEFITSRYYLGLTERTKDDYQYYLKRELKPYWEKYVIREIEYMDVQLWVDSMTTKWSAATLRKPFNQFREIMKFAVRSKYIPYNPCIEVETPPISAKIGLRMSDQENIKVWTENQVKSFLSWEGVQNTKWYPMLLISFSTAARPGEVCGLWRNGLDGDILRFENGIDTKGRITNLKNERAHREICVSQKVIDAVKAVLMWQARCKVLRGENYIEDDHLFRTDEGAPITPIFYGRAFKRLINNYNTIHPKNPLPVISIYKARHTWSTIADEKHTDPKVIAAVMGHSSVHTSSENYIDISADRIRRATAI